MFQEDCVRCWYLTESVGLEIADTVKTRCKFIPASSAIFVDDLSPHASTRSTKIQNLCSSFKACFFFLSRSYFYRIAAPRLLPFSFLLQTSVLPLSQTPFSFFNLQAD